MANPSDNCYGLYPKKSKNSSLSNKNNMPWLNNITLVNTSMRPINNV